MRQWIRLITLATCAVVASGCTNYVYQGSIKAEDSVGVLREVVLYWNKTAPLIGDEKADMAHLLTECGDLVVFENQAEGIIFRGEPGRDRVVIVASGSGDAGAITSGKGLECGRIVSASDLKELGAGKVSLLVRCEPVSNEFSVKKRSYIRARQLPYDFNVKEDKTWSLFGSTPRLPAPLPCLDN